MNGGGQPRGEQSGLPLEMHHGYYIVVVCFGLESERPFIIQGDQYNLRQTLSIWFNSLSLSFVVLPQLPPLVFFFVFLSQKQLAVTFIVILCLLTIFLQSNFLALTLPFHCSFTHWSKTSEAGRSPSLLLLFLWSWQTKYSFSDVSDQKTTTTTKAK